MSAVSSLDQSPAVIDAEQSKAAQNAAPASPGTINLGSFGGSSQPEAPQMQQTAQPVAPQSHPETPVSPSVVSNPQIQPTAQNETLIRIGETVRTLKVVLDDMEELGLPKSTRMYLKRCYKSARRFMSNKIVEAAQKDPELFVPVRQVSPVQPVSQALAIPFVAGLEPEQPAQPAQTENAQPSRSDEADKDKTKSRDLDRLAARFEGESK